MRWKDEWDGTNWRDRKKTCCDSKKLLDVFAVVRVLKYLHEISPVFLSFDLFDRLSSLLSLFVFLIFPERVSLIEYQPWFEHNFMKQISSCNLYVVINFIDSTMIVYCFLGFLLFHIFKSWTRVMDFLQIKTCMFQRCQRLLLNSALLLKKRWRCWEVGK